MSTTFSRKRSYNLLREGNVSSISSVSNISALVGIVITIGVISIVGLVLGAVAVSWGKNDPMKNVNADVATIGDLQITNKERKVLYVGATREFKTVSEALCQFNGRHITGTTIRVDPGVYDDNIEIGNNYTAGMQVGLPDNAYTDGLDIIGDTRPLSGLTFTHGAPNLVPDQGITEIRTNVAGLGPITVSDFASFTSYNGVPPVTATGKGAPSSDIVQCTPAPVNYYAGQIAIISRGACGFFAKMTNAINAGAVGMIVYTLPGQGYVGMVGGTDGLYTQPALSVLYDDGQALLQNPTAQITIGSFFALPLGDNGATVTLSHPGGANTVKVDAGNLNPVNFLELQLAVNDEIIEFVPTPSASGSSSINILHRITNITADTLTLDTPLTAAFGKSGSSITFIPNVVFTGVIGKQKPIVSIQNSGITFEGVTFGLLREGETTAGPLVAVNSHVNMVGCVLYGGSRAFMSLFQSSLYSIGREQELGAFTIIAVRTVVEYHSTLSLDFLSYLGDSLIAFHKSIVDINRLNLIQGNSLNLPDQSPLTIYDSATLTVRETLYMLRYSAASPAIEVSRHGGALISNLILTGPVQDGQGIGILVREQAKFQVESASITGSDICILADGQSRVLSAEGQVELINCTTHNQLIMSDAVYSEYFNYGTFGDITYTANNVYSVVTNETLSSAHPNQIINTGSDLVNIEFNPYSEFAGRFYYVGKSYTISNFDGLPHSISVVDDGFNKFSGEGVPTGTVKYTFPSAVTTVRFEIVGFENAVIYAPSGTFTLGAKKRSIAPRSQELSAHAMTDSEKSFMMAQHHSPQGLKQDSVADMA